MRKYIVLAVLVIGGIINAYGQDKYVYENSALEEPATKDKKGYVAKFTDIPKYIVTKESEKFYDTDRFFIYENSALKEPATKDKDGYVYVFKLKFTIRC